MLGRKLEPKPEVELKKKKTGQGFCQNLFRNGNGNFSAECCALGALANSRNLLPDFVFLVRQSKS